VAIGAAVATSLTTRHDSGSQSTSSRCELYFLAIASSPA
jgi:hypothetical protein